MSEEKSLNFLEEIIAEDFRSFMVDETLYTGFIGKIFKKIN